MSVHVLLVDDDPGLRIAIRKTLTRFGYDVSTLASGADAISVFNHGHLDNRRIDIAILDLRLEDMSGADVLEKTYGRPFPVIVLTGHGTVPDAVRALQLGASDFVQKPIPAHVLSSKIEEVLCQWSGAQIPVGAPVSLEEIEFAHVQALLEKHESVSAVARILCIDRRTLQRKLANWRHQAQVDLSSAK